MVDYMLHQKYFVEIPVSTTGAHLTVIRGSWSDKGAGGKQYFKNHG